MKTTVFSYRGYRNLKKTKVFSYGGYKNIRKTNVFSYRGPKNFRITKVFSYRDPKNLEACLCRLRLPSRLLRELSSGACEKALVLMTSSNGTL